MRLPRATRQVFIRIQGVQQYIWRAVDQNGVVLDILVEGRRDANAAKRFFKSSSGFCWVCSTSHG